MIITYTQLLARFGVRELLDQLLFIVLGNLSNKRRADTLGRKPETDIDSLNQVFNMQNKEPVYYTYLYLVCCGSFTVLKIKTKVNFEMSEKETILTSLSDIESVC